VIDSPIQHNMTPPEGAVPTGEMYGGRIVYARTVSVPTKVLLRDPDTGDVQYHYHEKTGQRIKAKTDLEWADREEEFVLMPLGNGNTEIVRDFRPHPETEARKKAVAAISNENLAAEIDLMKRMMAAVGIDPNDPAARADLAGE
jgi:hypothetical protein